MCANVPTLSAIHRNLSAYSILTEADMNKDQIEGVKKEITGNVKELAGKLVGNTKLQTEGTTEKIAGKLQNAAGGIKDVLKK